MSIEFGKESSNPNEGVALIKDIMPYGIGNYRFVPLVIAKRMERADKCKIFLTGKSVSELEKQMIEKKM